MTPRTWALAATLLCAAPSVGCSTEPARAEPAREPSAVAVRLADIERGPVERPVRAAGILGDGSAVTLSFKVGGVVTRVLVREGQQVKRGQLLAAIDPTEVQAGLSQAERAVEKAERDLERLRFLHDSQSAPLADLQNAETGLSLARATADAAAFNARHASVLAPEDGVVDRRLVEVGEVVAPGHPAFQLSTARQRARVRVALADRDALDVTLGDAARVVFDARPAQSFRAHVSEIAGTASPGTGTFAVELTLDEAPAGGLPAGLTAKVEIARVEAASASVPLSALVDGEGSRAAVYVVDGQRARRVPVALSFLAGERAFVASGLEQLSAVVDQGAAQLSDGAAVRVVR
jgi:multidrug efflux system membrane fusion protein